MAYATIEDLQARMARTLEDDETRICAALLEDAAVIIDGYNAEASEDAKRIVSCRMIIRMLGDGQSVGIPIGASQGSQSALGYSQSWTFATGGGSGELYLTKEERRLLGVAGQIGSYSPTEELIRTEAEA